MPIRLSLPTPSEAWRGLVNFALSPLPTRREVETVYGGVSWQGAFRAIQDREEWNPELTGTEGLKTLDRMAASDPTVSAVLRAYTAPILATEWSVDPADDMDPRAVAAADLVREQLFGMDDMSWDEWVEEALEFLIFGFYSFEKVWDFSGGVARLTRLSPRPPTVIDDVISDQHGRLAGIEQTLSEVFLPGPHVPAEVSGKPRTDSRIWIPASKLCHLVRRRRGADWAGQSMLRPIYKPWYMKKELEMIAGIVIERHATGVPTMRQVGDKSPASKNEASDALMGLTTREAQHLVVPKGWEFAVEGLRGGTISPETFLNYCDVAIARGVGVEFVMMGTGSTGSFSQHKDKTSLFMNSLTRVTKVIKSAIERQVIADIVRFNLGADFPRELMPKLQHTRLDSRDVGEIANAFSMLRLHGGIGELTADDVNALRKLVELAPLDASAAAEQDEVEDDDEPEDDHPEGRPVDGGEKDEEADVEMGSSSEAGGGCAHVAGAIQAAGALDKSDFPVTAYLNADGIRADLLQGEQRIMDSARRAQRKMVSSMVEFARYQWAAPGDRSRRVLRPPMEGVREIGDAFASELSRLAEVGKQQVEAEIGAQAGHHGVSLAVSGVDVQRQRSVDSYLISKGDALSQTMAALLNAAYQAEILPMIASGELDALALERTMNARALAELSRRARLAVGEALSMGRKAQQKDFEEAGQVAYYVYSTATESNTCPACEILEGTRIEPGSPRFEELYPPLRGGPLGPCEGGDGCNCDLFAVFLPPEN